MPSVLPGQPEPFSPMKVRPDDMTQEPIAPIGEALSTIRALEARSRKQHEQLLEDTQALADSYNGLVHQNAERIAEMADLKKELAAIRAELSALKARGQRRPSRLAHSPD